MFQGETPPQNISLTVCWTRGLRHIIPSVYLGKMYHVKGSKGAPRIPMRALIVREFSNHKTPMFKKYRSVGL